MERCPNCRARLDGGETCRRCGIELAALIEVEEAAEHLMQLGASHLAAGDTAAATEVLTQALALRREPLAETLLGFTRMLRQKDMATSCASASARAVAHSAEITTA